MDLFTELQTAKSNVKYLLDNESALVDMHGLVYWAQEVERLRERIKKTL